MLGRVAARCSRRVPIRLHVGAKPRCDHRLAAGAAGAKSLSTAASAAASGGDAEPPTDEQVHWTLFSELDVKADADKVRLAAFIDLLQGPPPAAKKPATRPGPATLGKKKRTSPRLEELRKKMAREAAGLDPEGEDALLSETDQLTAESVEALLSRLLDAPRSELGTSLIASVVPSVELKKVLRQAATALKALPTVVELPPLAKGQEITVVGDIHGQLIDLEAIFESAGFPSETNRYIFNGNHIDRGECSLEVLIVLLSYVLVLP